MVTGIQSVYDSRAAIVTQMQEITQAAAKEGRAMSQEEVSKWEKMEADEASMTKTIRATEQTEKLAAEQAARHFEQRDAAGGVWTSTATKKDDKGKEAAHREAFVSYAKRGFTGISPEERALVTEYRGTSTQVVGTDSLGGYATPDTWSPTIEKYMLSYSGILQAVGSGNVMRTSDGRKLYIPTVNDTTTKAVKRAEAAATTVQDVTLSQVEIDAYAYDSTIKISWELMQDNAYNLEARFQEMFADRFGRALNEQCTVGDGTGDPNGVVVASTLGKTAASATAITLLEVLDLKHSIDPAYRQSSQFGFMFNDVVLLALKKLVDSESRPLWTPSYREGEPDKIDGNPYWVNQDMDSTINAASKIMLCGDFSKYLIRISQDLRIMRLNELYAASGLVGFQATMRFDGDLLNTAAVKHLITAP